MKKSHADAGAPKTRAPRALSELLTRASARAGTPSHPEPRSAKRAIFQAKRAISSPHRRAAYVLVTKLRAAGHGGNGLAEHADGAGSRKKRSDVIRKALHHAPTPKGMRCLACELGSTRASLDSVSPPAIFWHGLQAQPNRSQASSTYLPRSVRLHTASPIQSCFKLKTRRIIALPCRSTRG